MPPKAAKVAAILDKFPEGKDAKKTKEELTKQLSEMTKVLTAAGKDASSSDAVAQLAQDVYQSNLIELFVDKLAFMEFECRKDVVQIFNRLIRREVGPQSPTVDWILNGHTGLLEKLCLGYEQPDIALSTGAMLRECIKKEPLAKHLLASPELFDKFFGYVEQSQFDVASDAFSTFKDLLTAHKIPCSQFLETNYDTVFAKYLKLLESQNYVTKRQSLKLLGELLLDRTNFTVMTRFIGDASNLRLMMNLLRDPSKNIQFEAFHVFKVFVANPNKEAEIKSILLKNKDKLVKFLDKFHQDRAEDEQFAEEKQYLIKQITALQ
eukprot:m.354675 g.354675  ORF g.354675 m.354675 type:complete len:322 (-) comp17079_c0_seq1:347-1312(-)